MSTVIVAMLAVNISIAFFISCTVRNFAHNISSEFVLSFVLSIEVTFLVVAYTNNRLICKFVIEACQLSRNYRYNFTRKQTKNVIEFYCICNDNFFVLEKVV